MVPGPFVISMDVKSLDKGQQSCNVADMLADSFKESDVFFLQRRKYQLNQLLVVCFRKTLVIRSCAPSDTVLPLL
jgi:hypothetical protein